MSDINEKTGLPHKLNLADVLSDLEVTPFQAAALLAHWGSGLLGGAADETGRVLVNHSGKVTNPDTYKDRQPANRDEPRTQADFSRNSPVATPTAQTTGQPLANPVASDFGTASQAQGDTGNVSTSI